MKVTIALLALLLGPTIKAPARLVTFTEKIEIREVLVIPTQPEVGDGQPATGPESNTEGSDKPQPESEGRSG